MGLTPWLDEITTIWPPPCSSIGLSTHDKNSAAPSPLTRSIWLSASGRSPNRSSISLPTPMLFTAKPISTRPSASRSVSNSSADLTSKSNRRVRMEQLKRDSGTDYYYLRQGENSEELVSD